MKGFVNRVWGNAFCEIWLMRGNVEIAYKKFTTVKVSVDGYYYYDIVIDDFFMQMDTPTGTGSVGYWVKMRTYTHNQTEHDKIQSAMRCAWMLLEVKR